MGKLKMRGLIAALTLTRTAISTGLRMVYPFLPALARGMGVEPEAVILAVTTRSGLGITSPVLGSLGDLRGRRIAMLVGVAIFVLGLAPVAIWPSYATFFVGMLATGLSLIVLVPAQQALFGDRVAFERRGTPIALVELSWSGAFLVGVPAIGLLIASFGWQAPFPVLAGLALLGGVWLWRIFPRDPRDRLRANTLLRNLSAIGARRSALAGLSVGMLLSGANETVAIVFGLWMEDSFGLQVAALGAASAVIGLGELGGEGLAAGVLDRLGKRRSLAAGILLSGMAYLALPTLTASLTGALLGLFVLYLTFEYSVVSALPLMTEQVPQARSTLMATHLAAISVGRSLGALAGGPLFARGIQANTYVAAALNLLALALLIAFVKERGELRPARAE